MWSVVLELCKVLPAFYQDPPVSTLPAGHAVLFQTLKDIVNKSISITMDEETDTEVFQRIVTYGNLLVLQYNSQI